jgi:peptidoglycan hydrolase-like protein with peptidoglycan-binding domain
MKKITSKFLLLASVFIFGMTQITFAETYPEFCAVFNRTLKPGDVGQDVKRLQVTMGQEGIAYLASTGYYGPGTEKAVKVFQQRNGIYPAGKVGPQTYRFMRNLW